MPGVISASPTCTVAWFTNSWPERLRSNLDEQQDYSGPFRSNEGRTTRLQSAFPSAGSLRRHFVSQLSTAVSAPADVRQDGAAVAGRHAGGVEHLHGFFPGRAASGLCVC